MAAASLPGVSASLALLISARTSAGSGSSSSPAHATDTGQSDEPTRQGDKKKRVRASSRGLPIVAAGHGRTRKATGLASGGAKTVNEREHESTDDKERRKVVRQRERSVGQSRQEGLGLRAERTVVTGSGG